MRLSNIVSENEFARLSELDAPMLGATPLPGAAQPAPVQSGQPPGGLDPKQAAMMIKQRADQKKQLQDQIVQTQKQLQDLQKQLAQLR
jgi:hypothetical protein